MYYNNGNGVLKADPLNPVASHNGRTMSISFADFNKDGYADILMGKQEMNDGRTQIWMAAP